MRRMHYVYIQMWCLVEITCSLRNPYTNANLTRTGYTKNYLWYLMALYNMLWIIIPKTDICIIITETVYYYLM